MKTIYKYEIDLATDLCSDDTVEMMLPDDAEILEVGFQRDGVICFWALISPDVPVSRRRLMVKGTGHEIDLGLGNLEHLGTVIMGFFVWHVFEIRDLIQ